MKKVPYRPAWLLVGAVVLALGVAVAGGAAVWNSVYRASPLTLGWLTTLNPFGSSDQSIEIAVALPLTGAFGPVGQGTLEGIQMAVDEANVGGLPPIKLTVYDDKSSDDEAKAVAGKIVASRATLVLGPALSTASVAAGPIYAQAGLASLPPTATSDVITQNPTTFRVLFANSEEGQTLATYLIRALGSRRARVLVVDSTYGQTLQQGFRQTATRLGIDAQYDTFKNADEAQQLAKRVASESPKDPIVLLTLNSDAARILPILKRAGVAGPFLGGDSLGDQVMSDLVANLPEERQTPGYFTENLYAVTPITLDSANAEILNLVQRFRARFGHDPIWRSTAGYDAARLAIAAVRSAAPTTNPAADRRAVRTAVVDFLLSLNSPVATQPGLLGPFWFDETRGRREPIRMGRFYHGRFQSAPLQIVPVAAPEKADLASGAVFEVTPGSYGRLQRVVYTGVYVREVGRVDPPSSTFSADFYLWLRYAPVAPGSPDPTDLRFINLVSGGFDRAAVIDHHINAEGEEYGLWRVQGVFRTDFDLRRYPFDRQNLRILFAHTTAPADQIVYVLDDQTTANQPAAAPTANASGGPTGAATSGIVAPDAYRTLVQWQPRQVSVARNDLVTPSATENSGRAAADSQREISTVLVTVEVGRVLQATLVKTLLPLLALALILLAGLYLPTLLVVEKLSLALLAALAGAVLLYLVRAQVGAVAYPVAADYVFYVFFGLALITCISALAVPRLRVIGQVTAAVVVERGTRILLMVALMASLVAVFVLTARR